MSWTAMWLPDANRYRRYARLPAGVRVVLPGNGAGWVITGNGSA